MARCYICNTFIDEPRIDRKTGKIAHCRDCDTVITETLSDFDEPEALDFVEEDVLYEHES